MLLLIPIGVFFAVVYVLVAGVQTLRRRTVITFLDVLLIFLAVLLPHSALVLSGLDGAPDALYTRAALLTAGGLALTGLLLAIIEVFRPQRLRQSRGLLTLGAALLLGVSGLAVPYVAAYIALPNAAAVTTPAPPTAIAGQPTLNSTQAVEQRFQSLFEGLFADIFAIIAQETGLDTDQILTALDGGASVAQLVAANGGDVERVVSDVTERFRNTVVVLVQDGTLPRGQGALILSQVGFFVRMTVENDLYTLIDRFGGGTDQLTGTPDPAGGSRSLFAFLTVTATPTSVQVAAAATMTATSPPTPLPTATRTPSATRTPRPTLTPTATRTRFVLPTLTATPTQVVPCVLVMDYNVNLRARPSLDAPLLTTVPFEQAVVAFARDASGDWWFADYDGQSGWLKAEFVTATSACQRLPVRRP